MRTLIFAVCAIAIAAQAEQNQPKSAQGPRPDPALSKAFADSVGSWTCKGKMTLPKEMGGGELDTRSSMTIKKELNGFAYSGEWKSEKNKAFPAMSGKMTWAYDAGTKKLTEFSVSSFGDVMRGDGEPGEGGNVVWNEEGTMMGKPAKSRTTVTMKGKTALDLAFDMQGEGGSWTPMGKESCTKGGSETAKR